MRLFVLIFFSLTLNILFAQAVAGSRIGDSYADEIYFQSCNQEDEAGLYADSECIESVEENEEELEEELDTECSDSWILNSLTFNFEMIRICSAGRKIRNSTFFNPELLLVNSGNLQVLRL
jgi:hypothetical protein